MTDRHPSLSPAEEALLDFSLGLASELAPGVDPTEAARWRSLVQEVRVTSEVPIDPRRVASLIAAARLTAEPPTPSFWQVLEGGLRTSLLLRVVAASLVVHLCALPVLAWLQPSDCRSCSFTRSSPPCSVCC